MFTNNAEEEADFCEAYKSQILNNVHSDEKPSPWGFIIKIITILILLAIVIAGSIYGYIYFMNRQTNSVVLPPVSVQPIVEDDELKVSLEEPDNNISGEKADSKDVKVAIPKDKQKESNKTIDTKAPKKIEEPLKVPTGDAESAYIEELAKLTEEVDKERK